MPFLSPKCSIRLLPLLLCMLCFISIKAQQKPIKVNADRLNQSLSQLASYGKLANGATDRVAYTQADIEARLYVMDLMKKAGLSVHIDAAGNIIPVKILQG